MVKFEAEVVNKGRLLDNILHTNLLILFDKRLNDFLKDFGVEHNNAINTGGIKENDILDIDGQEYIITKIGNKVNEELPKTGHTAIKIGTELDTDTDNMILVSGESFPVINEGTKIIIRD